MSSESPSTTADKSVSSPHGCPVCSKIVQVLTTNNTYWGTSEAVLGKVHDILAYECVHTDWLRDIKYDCGNVPRDESRELRLHKHKGIRGARLGVCYTVGGSVHTPRTRTLPLELVSRPDVPNHKGTVHILDREWIDAGLMKNWISRCFQEHGSHCDTSAIRSIRPFYPQWLIDVDRGCVAACPEDGPLFATLSYTWGQTAHFRTTRANIDQVQEAGALLYGPIATKVPETIQNAILLTKALGLAWLWVDSLCIVQDDKASLPHQLRNMHHIYATSVLTIIAKDGQDAGYGLRGVRGISRPRSTEQLVVPLAGGESAIMMEPEDTPRVPSKYDYEQRMWTFQEEAFAKRRLIFKGGRVGWKCNCANWHESQSNHLEAGSSEAAEWYARASYGGIQGSPPSLGKLDSLVALFNQRTLGFDEDVFNAFSGLQTHLNSIFPSGLVLGHPEFFFEISLCWKAFRKLRRRRISESYAGDPLRDRLPSWSWMGWQGETYFPDDHEHDSSPSVSGAGFTQAVTEWYAFPTPGSTTKHLIDSTWHRYREGTSIASLEGWQREELKPLLEWPANLYHIWNWLGPICMPKDLPAYVYTHVSREGNRGDPQWYPVPVGNSNFASDDEELISHREFQYLQCLTTRAYLQGNPDNPQSPKWDYDALIQDVNGNLVGGLAVHHEDDLAFLANGRRIELIAVAKGWTTELKEVEQAAEGALPPTPEKDGRPLNQEEEEENVGGFVEAEQRAEFRTLPWKEQWEIARSMKQDCYYVLWIEWERGIAYRRGCGFVLADKWEELAGVDKIEVTLG
ncbi:HET-domain-containing protein [Apiospora sp. TS-2023a]